MEFGGNLMIFILSGATYQPVALSTSATLSTSKEIREVTTKDSVDWVENVSGMLSWTMATDGLVSYNVSGSTNGVEKLWEYYISEDPVSVYFAIKSGTTPSWSPDTSKKYYKGNAIVNQFDISASNKENATYSISLTGTGALEIV
jgi:TP901-1 family phage major tail protein